MPKCCVVGRVIGYSYNCFQPYPRDEYINLQVGCVTSLEAWTPSKQLQWIIDSFLADLEVKRKVPRYRDLGRWRKFSSNQGEGCAWHSQGHQY